MSTYCDCCSSNRAWVSEHLNFDPHQPGIRPERWGEKRWLAYAQECIEFWASQGDPINIDPTDLAALMQEVYL